MAVPIHIPPHNTLTIDCKLDRVSKKMKRILTFVYNLILYELMLILGGVGFVFFFLLFLSPREEGLVDPKMLGEVKIVEVRETSTIVENSYGIRVKVRQRVNESDVGQTKTLVYTDSYQFE